MSPLKYEKKIEIIERENDKGILVVDARKEEKVLIIDFDILRAIKDFFGI